MNCFNSHRIGIAYWLLDDNILHVSEFCGTVSARISTLNEVSCFIVHQLDSVLSFVQMLRLNPDREFQPSDSSANDAEQEVQHPQRLLHVLLPSRGKIELFNALKQLSSSSESSLNSSTELNIIVRPKSVGDTRIYL